MVASLNYFQPYQIAWIKDEAPTAIVEKSRRIGFTYAEAYRSVERRVLLGTHHYFASRDKESAGEFIEYCKYWVRGFEVAAEDLGEQVIDSDLDMRAFVIRFANGGKIVALSSNPDAFRSKGGDVTLDEFAFHRDPRAVLKGAQASAMILGHSLRIISTHNGEGSVFNLIIREIRKGARKWSLHRVTLQDAVDQGFVERVKGLPGIDVEARRKFIADVRADCISRSDYDQEFDVIPGSDDASLLSYDLIQACEVDGLKLCEIGDLPRAGLLYAGYDVGRSKDLSVLWVWELVGDIYWTRALKRFPKMKYTMQEDALNQLMSNPAVKRECIDKGLIGGMLAERQEDKWGYRAEGIQLSNPMQNELAMPMLRAMEDRRLRIPAEAETRESLHKVRKIVAGNLVRFVAPHDDAGHADEFWAAALGLHAADDLAIPLPPPMESKPAGW